MYLVISNKLLKKVLSTILLKPVISSIGKRKLIEFSSNALTIAQLRPIKMSYASYENANTPSKDIPPLVIMHGLFGSKSNWNSLCKEFLKYTIPQRKIIAVDARNHGDSPHSEYHTYPHLAEDIKALLEQLNIEKAALIGHSMGGRAVMYFTLKYSQFVEKLIVVDISAARTSTNFVKTGALFGVLEKVAMPKDVSITIARKEADQRLAKDIDDKNLRGFLLTNLVQKADGSYTWRMNLPVLLANYFDNLLNFPNVNDLKYDGPVLFISGANSDFFQKSDEAPSLKLFPKAQFEEITDAGHWVHSEKPKEFLQNCLKFLNV